MTKAISKSQIDRLGERLKKGKIEDDELRLLDQYRRSFAEAYDAVIEAVSRDLLLEPTGRPAKSTSSVVDKLRRESIRLTQIQDIAGCRIVVNDIATQDLVVQSLKGLFGNSSIIDRRIKPSHGYRAMHVVVSWQNRFVEIQVRTSLQHLWAELSEKLSDVYGNSIKYGGGNDGIQSLLRESSITIAKLELDEAYIAEHGIQNPGWEQFLKSMKCELSRLLAHLISIKWI